jgi:hypothetical protein
MSGDVDSERLAGAHPDSQSAATSTFPKTALTVHDLYFEPEYEEFRARTIWSLSNAFTSAFEELDLIPQFKATAKLREFLEERFSQSLQVCVAVLARRPILCIASLD